MNRELQLVFHQLIELLVCTGVGFEFHPGFFSRAFIGATLTPGHRRPGQLWSLDVMAAVVQLSQLLSPRPAALCDKTCSSRSANVLSVAQDCCCEAPSLVGSRNGGCDFSLAHFVPPVEVRVGGLEVLMKTPI